MRRILAVGLCMVAGAWGAQPARPALSPFGVCAHLGGGDEYNALVQELDLMQKAGIRWARADFTWGAIEPADGQFDFSRYDRVVSEALAREVMPLPILCYSSPWAGLAHENLPAWTRFVETVVRRYADRIRHWEVWNEPNIEFWKPKPDPAQYTALLRATHRAIKAIDPDLQVVYGGTAGIPLDFIRRTLELGAGECFDIMAIHPYSYPDTAEASGRLRELAQLRDLLAEFKAPGRIWVTETGWPTHRDQGIEEYLPMWRSLVYVAAALVFPERIGWSVAVLRDQSSVVAGQAAAALMEDLESLGLGRCRWVTAGEVAAGLSPPQTQVLIGPIGEGFPEPAFAGMVEFVRRGGLLVHFGGVPFYYTANPGPEGWVQSPHPAPESFRKALHIGWKAWWTHKGVPEEAPITRRISADLPVILPSKGLKTTRWFTDAALRGNDRMIPLLAGYNEETLIGHPSALYILDSDLKGAVLVNCVPVPVQRGVTPAVQARHLARAYLTYLAHGVEVFFWYEFRDGGRKPDYNEHNFGIITSDLEPKPAYVALQQLIAALGQEPVFTGPPETSPEGVTRVSLTGRDGAAVTAFWADRPGLRVPVTARSFRVCDATWSSAPVEGDEEGVRVRLDEGPVFLVEPAPPAGSEETHRP